MPGPKFGSILNSKEKSLALNLIFNFNLYMDRALGGTESGHPFFGRHILAKEMLSDEKITRFVISLTKS